MPSFESEGHAENKAGQQIQHSKDDQYFFRRFQFALLQRRRSRSNNPQSALSIAMAPAGDTEGQTARRVRGVMQIRASTLPHGLLSRPDLRGRSRRPVAYWSESRRGVFQKSRLTDRTPGRDQHVDARIR